MRVKNLSKNIVDFDLTDHLTKASYEVETNKIHLEVESFDDNGDSIPPIAYKPTFDYIDATSRKIKIHVDHFEHYAPEIEFSDVHLWVEFFKSDGTYSDQVKGRTSYENGTIIKKDIDANAPTRLNPNRNEFTYKGHIMVLKRDPLAQVKPMPGRLLHLMSRKVMRSCIYSNPMP